MWKQRLHKEIWSKDELRNFHAETDAGTLQKKYGIKSPEGQKIYTAQYFPNAHKEKKESDGRSTWSSVAPDPKLQNEKEIWKTKIYEKNQKSRHTNQAIGFLGNYSIGDLDMVARLDDKLKAVSTRAKNNKTLVGGGTLKHSRGFRGSHDFAQGTSSELIPKRKPATLEPLPFEIQNKEVAYRGKRNSVAGSQTGKNVSDTQSRFRDNVSTKSRASQSRVLKIKGQSNGSYQKKQRFNEEVDDETRSIRQNVAQTLNQRMTQIANKMNQVNASKAGSVIQGSRTQISQRPSIDLGISKTIPVATSVGLAQKLNTDIDKEINYDSASQIAALQRMKRFEHERMAKLIDQEKQKLNQHRMKGSVSDLKSVSQAHTRLSGNRSRVSINSNTKPSNVKYDADSGSCITYNTDTSSLLHNPSSLNTYASSKMEMQLNFLAKQLELEKQRREKLQAQVMEMQVTLKEQEDQARGDVKKNQQDKKQREANVKPAPTDIADLKTLQGGFVSIQ